jgi:hypothetical protein
MQQNRIDILEFSLAMAMAPRYAADRAKNDK